MLTVTALSQVDYFVRRYNDLLPFSSPQEHDKLSEEFTDYQLLNDNEVPESVWKSAVVQDDESCTFYRMDMIWHYLSNLKAVDGKNRFSRISRVAKLVLVIVLSFLIQMLKKREFFPWFERTRPHSAQILIQRALCLAF